MNEQEIEDWLTMGPITREMLALWLSLTNKESM